MQTIVCDVWRRRGNIAKVEQKNCVRERENCIWAVPEFCLVNESMTYCFNYNFIRGRLYQNSFAIFVARLRCDLGLALCFKFALKNHLFRTSKEFSQFPLSHTKTRARERETTSSTGNNVERCEEREEDRVESRGDGFFHPSEHEHHRHGQRRRYD